MTLRRSEAMRIIDGALAHALSAGAAPMAVVVVDAGGHPVAYAREDGASFFRHDIALAKATGAIGMGTDTRSLADKAKANPAFFGSLSQVVGGRIAYSPGGVVIRRDGSLIGAVGVSGDTGEMDEAAAHAGLAAAGLAAGDQA